MNTLRALARARTPPSASSSSFASDDDDDDDDALCGSPHGEAPPSCRSAGAESARSDGSASTLPDTRELAALRCERAALRKDNAALTFLGELQLQQLREQKRLASKREGEQTRARDARASRAPRARLPTLSARFSDSRLSARARASAL